MGALLIGVTISAVLHGVTLIQAYNYFACQPKTPFHTMTRLLMLFIVYPNDSLRLKISVMVLVLSDAAHLALMTQVGERPAVNRFISD